MSLALLKQSMGILEEDLPQAKTTKKQTPKEATLKPQKTQPNKQKFFDQQTQKTKKSLKDIKHELSQGGSKSDANLRRLLALSQNTVKVTDANKIVKRAHKGRYVDIELPKVEQESIFTEEDFRAFEAEYFNS